MIPRPPLLVRAPIALLVLLAGGLLMRVGFFLQDVSEEIVPEFRPAGPR